MAKEELDKFMKKKKIVAAVISLFVLSTASAFAVEKEYTFTTTDKDYASKTVDDIGKGDLEEIPKSIKDNRLSSLSAKSITFTLKSSTEPQEVTYENLTEKKLPEGSEEIEKDGKLLKLSDTKWESAGRTPITGTSTIKGSDKKPEFAASKKVTATLADGSVVTADCKLIKVEQSGSSYSKTFTVSAKFYGDSEVDYYVFGEAETVQIPNGSLSPQWQGYENQILKALGLDSSEYRITSGKWTSGYEDENGAAVRYAEFSGVRKSSDWTAYYKEEAANEKLYTAICTYGPDAEYTVTATVDYSITHISLLGKVVIGSAAVIVIAGLIALILGLIGKKDKKEQ